ncbi:Bro-N domain-containing protein [Asticcacaulis sp.]|uniref:BRO-N domain-containing protein n=1 Tax=Asticcacaulis sp. TaxID=1872648 RepID=UPI00391D633C
MQEHKQDPRILSAGVRELFRKNDSALTAISESGLYKLIMRSEKAEAVVFQNWIAEEILPSIRRPASTRSPTRVGKLCLSCLDRGLAPSIVRSLERNVRE